MQIQNITLDASDESSLTKVLAEVSVTINAASPFINLPVMNSCLASNTHYIDLASDPIQYPGLEGTSIEDQLKLDNNFKGKQLIALTNTGFAPGFTDLLTKYAIEEMNIDIIKSLKIFFADTIKANRLVASWSPHIILFETLSPPTVYNGQEIVEIGDHEARRKIKFPEPIGNIETRIFSGHPELRTIPEFAGVKVDRIEVGGGYRINDLELDSIIATALREKIRYGSEMNGDIFEVLASAFDSPDSFIDQYNKGTISDEHLCCLFELNGISSGNEVNFNAIITHDLKEVLEKCSGGSVASFIVSIVPAILAERIAAGEIKETGVIAPAALSNVKPLINECVKRGLSLEIT